MSIKTLLGFMLSMYAGNALADKTVQEENLFLKCGDFRRIYATSEHQHEEHSYRIDTSGALKDSGYYSLSVSSEYLEIVRDSKGNPLGCSVELQQIDRQFQSWDNASPNWIRNSDKQSDYGDSRDLPDGCTEMEHGEIVYVSGADGVANKGHSLLKTFTGERWMLCPAICDCTTPK